MNIEKTELEATSSEPGIKDEPATKDESDPNGAPGPGKPSWQQTSVVRLGYLTE